MSKKKSKRTWRGVVSPTPVEQSPIQSWQVVMAELKPGLASVGVRFNQEDMVHFFLMHKPPAEAALVVADIAKGKITLKDIAGMDWQAVEMPHDYMESVDKKAQGEP